MATLDDISRALGISKSTVSKALNGAGDVSKATRRAVLEKAVELGYSRTMRGADAPQVVIFITSFVEYKNPDDFGYEIIEGFRKLAEPQGFQVDVLPLNQQMQTEIHYDEFMLRERYSGALFLGLIPEDPWMEDLKTCSAPAVLCDTVIRENPKVTHLGVDNLEGLELAVGYLKSLGHEKIGYLSNALDSYIYQTRYQAYLQAMESNGLSADSKMTGTAFHISDCLSRHLKRLLDTGCTALICSHDLLAGSAIVHCSELGLRVPEDVSILGFDDIPLCRYTVPPLTTIRQDRIELGRSGFYALASQINGVPMSTLLLHAQLVIRNSCGPVSK